MIIGNGLRVELLNVDESNHTYLAFATQFYVLNWSICEKKMKRKKKL
jgi:hypothetical protein